jgi:hypothetical protein
LIVWLGNASSAGLLATEKAAAVGARFERKEDVAPLPLAAVLTGVALDTQDVFHFLAAAVGNGPGNLFASPT